MPWIQRMVAICEAKTPYSSLRKALAAGGGYGYTPYRCQVCRDYHLTHKHRS